jgi:hypothetical protein
MADRAQSEPSATMPLELDSLQTALDHPELREAFKSHLAGEFSSENMEFYEAVDAYKAAAKDPSVSDEALRERAKQLFNTYVDASVTAKPGERVEHNKQVNLKSTTYGPIKTDFDNLATKNRAEMSSMFDAGKEEIVALMKRDSFQRFKAGPKCTAVMDDLNDTLTAEQEKVKQLQAQLEKLKTSKAEQFKAYFSGGTEKVKQDLQAQIEKANQHIEEISAPFNAAAHLQKQNQKSVEPPPPPKVEVPQHQGVDDSHEKDVEMSLEEQAEMGRGRSNAIDKGRKVEESGPQIDEAHEELKDTEEITTDEFAVVGRARSNTIDLGRKTEVTTVAPKGPSEEIPGLKKGASVRDSMGKKPDAPTVHEAHGPRAK